MGNETSKHNEGFMVYPKAPDAYHTGEFDTLQRECEAGLKKCMKPVNGGNGITYWCAPTCTNKHMQLDGVEIKEPMAWQVRFA